jgi:hypothetical protein
MSPAQKKQTPIRFTDPIRARLDEEVRRTGLSISVLVNIALDRYLPSVHGEPAPSPPTTTPAPAPAASDEGGVADFD